MSIGLGLGLEMRQLLWAFSLRTEECDDHFILSRQMGLAFGLLLELGLVLFVVYRGSDNPFSRISGELFTLVI